MDVEEQSVRHEARKAQLLAEIRESKEKFSEQISDTEATFHRQSEKLQMQYAVDHSNSRVAELIGKLKSCELMIQHLNERLEDSKYDRDQFSKCKVNSKLVSFWNYLIVFIILAFLVMFSCYFFA